jgi:hypothetical protein
MTLTIVALSLLSRRLEPVAANAPAGAADHARNADPDTGVFG